MKTGMNEKKRIYDMTDRELRIYKRKKRRLQECRKRMVMLFATFCLVVTCIVSFHSLVSYANDRTEEVSFKYYTGIVVHSGDSLWNLADQYIDYSQYRNKTEYIEEVCSINSLSDPSDIRAGQRIVVPYYSSEFIK